MESPWTTRPDLEVIKRLDKGEGRFGKVWKARHNVEKADYAVKQIPVDTTLRIFRGKVQDLLAEVKILQKVNSPYVVRYHTCWLEGEGVETLPDKSTVELQTFSSTKAPPPDYKFLFIQMEICEFTLTKWLDDRPNVVDRLPEVPLIYHHLALGLEAIHRLNIVHRDLKPDNILAKVVAERDGKKVVWKIGDFGLSRKAPEEEMQLDFATTAAGNMVYRSPDVDVTTKSDVFAMGIIFFEILYPSFSFYNAELKKCLKREVYSMLINWQNYSPRNKKIANPAEDIKGLIPPSCQKEYEIICAMCKLETSERVDAIELLKLMNVEISSPHLDSKDKQLWFEVGRPCSNFVGRTEDLNQLTDYFLHSTHLTTVISGLGGVGKSELVKTFAQLVFKELQGSCIWLEGESRSTLHGSVKKLGQKLGIPTSDSEDEAVQNLFNIYVKLNNLPKLLVIDNVDSLNSDVASIIRNFKRLGPDIRAPFIIITTRNYEIFSKLGGGFIDLKVLEDKYAMELVQSRLPSAPIEDAKSLCHTLQNYPLALQQAICFILERQSRPGSDFNVSKYIKLFNKNREEVLDRKLTLDNHDYSLTTLTTWRVSFETIKAFSGIGSIAEKLFKLFAYALDADNESVEFIVTLYNKLSDGQIREQNDDSESENSDSDSESTDSDSESEGSSSSSESEDNDDDIISDLEDDPRPVAKALQLIRNFSMCHIDKFKLGNTNVYVTVVSIHRLVQEVIRVNLRGSNQEKPWLSNLGKSLIQIDWENTDKVDRNFQESDLRGLVRIVKNVWKSVAKHKSLVREVKDVFVPIWDCGGLLLNSDIDFLDTTRHKLRKVVGDDDDLSIMILDYHFHLHLLNDNNGSQRYIFRTEMGEVQYQSGPVISLYLRQEGKSDPKPLKLALQTLDLLQMDAFKRGLSYGFPISCAVKIFFDSIMRKVRDSPDVPLEIRELFKLLCIAGHILQAYRHLKLFHKALEFVQSFMDLLKDRGPLEAGYFSCLVRYMRFFLSESTELQNESVEFCTKAFSLLGTDDFETLSPLDAEILKGFFRYNFSPGFMASVPYSVQMRLCLDSLNSPVVPISSSQLSEFLFWVTDFRDEVGKLIQLGKGIFKQCILGKFTYEDVLFRRLKDAEKKIWGWGHFEGALDMCQSLVRLCKFRDYWDHEEFLLCWIDDLLVRIGVEGEVFQKFYEQPFSIISKMSQLSSESLSTCTFELLAALIYEIKQIDDLCQLGDEVVTNLISNNCNLDCNPLATVTFFSRLLTLIGDSIWSKGGYSEFQNLIEHASEQLKLNGLDGYFEYKVAQDLVSKIQKSVSTENCPTSFLTWGFIFILKYSSRIAEIPDSSSIAVKLIERLEFGMDLDGMTKLTDEIAKILNKALICCDKSPDSDLSRSRQSYIVRKEQTPPVRIVYNLSRVKHITPRTYCEEFSDLETNEIIKSYILEEPPAPRRMQAPKCDVGGHLYNNKWSVYSRPDINMDKFLAPPERDVQDFPIKKNQLLRQSFWFALHTLGVLGHRLRNQGKLDEDFELFQRGLRLDKMHRMGKDDVIARQIAIVEYFQNWNAQPKSQLIVNAVLCQILRQKWQHGVQLPDPSLIHKIVQDIQVSFLKYIKFKDFIELYDSLMDLEAEFLAETGLGSDSILKPRFVRIPGATKWLREDMGSNHPFHFQLFEMAIKFSKRPDVKDIIDSEIRQIVEPFLQTELQVLVSEEFRCNVKEFIELFKFVLQYGPESENYERVLYKILDILQITNNYSDMHRLAFDIAYIPREELRLEVLAWASIEIIIGQYMRKACESDLERFRRQLEGSKRNFGNYTKATAINGLNNMDKFVNKMNVLYQQFELLECNRP